MRTRRRIGRKTRTSCKASRRRPRAGHGRNAGCALGTHAAAKTRLSRLAQAHADGPAEREPSQEIPAGARCAAARHPERHVSGRRAAAERGGAGANLWRQPHHGAPRAGAAGPPGADRQPPRQGPSGAPAARHPGPWPSEGVLGGDGADIFALLEKRLGIEIAFADITIEIATLGPEGARHLSLEADQQAIRIERLTYAADDWRPVDFEYLYGPPQSHLFKLRVPRW